MESTIHRYRGNQKSYPRRREIVSLSDLFWIILILIVLFGCSTTEEVARKQDSIESTKLVDLNIGTPSSEIAKKPHTFKYETVRSATSEQFMITKKENELRAPQRALKIDLSRKPVSKTLTIYFPLDSWELGPDQSRIIQRFISLNHPKEVDVTGYTCWFGSKKHNQWLALRRAREVASSLRKAGIKVRSVKGKGKCCYIDRKNPASNRRAEITVLL
ncbi:MAG: hypothetical protein DRG59_04835 [Deltaproteobacteria bacterium]|nr:MAG: hypothetical protein DRG59_04835 [Deltaproteobacteria bacterium]